MDVRRDEFPRYEGPEGDDGRTVVGEPGVVHDALQTRALLRLAHQHALQEPANIQMDKLSTYRSLMFHHQYIPASASFVVFEFTTSQKPRGPFDENEVVADTCILNYPLSVFCSGFPNGRVPSGHI